MRAPLASPTARSWRSRARRDGCASPCASRTRLHRARCRSVTAGRTPTSTCSSAVTTLIRSPACPARREPRSRYGGSTTERAPRVAAGRASSEDEARPRRVCAMPGKDANGSPSSLIDARIEELGDWRGDVLSLMRQHIKQTVPDVVEEWKWRGVPTWEHDGIICTGETYKDKVKLTFAKGASLDDPAALFNSSPDGNVRRAIDIFEGDKINERAFKSLVRAAAALNESSRRKPNR